MTKTSLCGLLFLSTTMMVQCMEENNNIGYIDTLVLKHQSAIEGPHNVQSSIFHHAFSANTPFIIQCIVHRKDKSSLSNSVFRITDEHEVIVNTANPLNKKQNLLDHCTEWEQSRKSPDSIKLTTNFYDKTALLAALDTLNKK